MLKRKATLAAELVPDDPLQTLKNSDGYYDCPEGPGGELLGPLVGYAGRYDDGAGNMLQYVGKKYYNFARAERFPHLRDYYARGIGDALIEAGIDFDAIIGAPMGGILLAGDIGRLLNRRTLFMEKKVTKAETDTTPEESRLVMDRHELFPGEEVVLSEDVVNNLSTTGKAWGIINHFGARLIAISCVINRSGKAHYEAPDGTQIPIVSFLWLPTEQFRQDDQAVAEYVRRGQLIKKPKHHWDELASAMAVFDATYKK